MKCFPPHRPEIHRAVLAVRADGPRLGVAQSGGMSPIGRQVSRGRPLVEMHSGRLVREVGTI